MEQAQRRHGNPEAFSQEVEQFSVKPNNILCKRTTSLPIYGEVGTTKIYSISFNFISAFKFFEFTK